MTKPDPLENLVNNALRQLHRAPAEVRVAFKALEEVWRSSRPPMTFLPVEPPPAPASDQLVTVALGPGPEKLLGKKELDWRGFDFEQAMYIARFHPMKRAGWFERHVALRLNNADGPQLTLMSPTWMAPYHPNTFDVAAKDWEFCSPDVAQLFWRSDWRRT